MSKNHKRFSAWFLFITMLFFAIINDFTVMVMNVPSLSEADIYEGTLKVNEGGRKIDRTLSIVGEGTKVQFTCWVWSGRGGNCLDKLQEDERKQLNGKKSKIYYYEAIVNGFFYEKRLLQLEVAGKIIESYQEQKNQYLNTKNGYLYIFSIATFLAFLWLLLIYIKNDD